MQQRVDDIMKFLFYWRKYKSIEHRDNRIQFKFYTGQSGYSEENKKGKVL